MCAFTVNAVGAELATTLLLLNTTGRGGDPQVPRGTLSLLYGATVFSDLTFALEGNVVIRTIVFNIGGTTFQIRLANAGLRLLREVERPHSRSHDQPRCQRRQSRELLMNTTSKRIRCRSEHFRHHRGACRSWPPTRPGHQPDARPGRPRCGARVQDGLNIGMDPDGARRRKRRWSVLDGLPTAQRRLRIRRARTRSPRALTRSPPGRRGPATARPAAAAPQPSRYPRAAGCRTPGRSGRSGPSSSEQSGPLGYWAFFMPSGKRMFAGRARRSAGSARLEPARERSARTDGSLRERLPRAFGIPVVSDVTRRR